MKEEDTPSSAGLDVDLSDMNMFFSMSLGKTKLVLYLEERLPYKPLLGCLDL